MHPLGAQAVQVAGVTAAPSPARGGSATTSREFVETREEPAASRLTTRSVEAGAVKVAA